MPRISWTRCIAAFCLGLTALPLGCQQAQQVPDPGPSMDSARPTPSLVRGENFYEQGQTRYFPVRFISADAVTVHDKWQPPESGDTEADLGYSIGEERFDDVVKLIGYLDGLDADTLDEGLVLIQQNPEKRPDWEQNINQLCVFAEFKNIQLWLRVPTEADDPGGEHAYWLVRQTEPEEPSLGAESVEGH